MSRLISYAHIYLAGIVSVFIIPKRYFNRVVYKAYDIMETNDGIDFILTEQE